MIVSSMPLVIVWCIVQSEYNEHEMDTQYGEQNKDTEEPDDLPDDLNLDGDDEGETGENGEVTAELGSCAV